jgi:hypothetical protein
LRRKERLAWVLERLDGMLRATHSAPRLVLAQHPVKERFDAFWIVQGRLVDWGPLPGPTELAERTEAALSRRPGRAVIPADEIDEIRIVASWVAEHEPPALTLDPAPAAEELARFADEAAPGSTAQARVAGAAPAARPGSDPDAQRRRARFVGRPASWRARGAQPSPRPTRLTRAAAETRRWCRDQAPRARAGRIPSQLALAS